MSYKNGIWKVLLQSAGNPNCPFCRGTGVRLGSEPGKVRICTG
ncbi:hypothetical protein ACFZB9_16515 [Kitasatospora sp. NPDC008050]